MDFLVFEVGKDKFFAVGELYVVDSIADGEFASVLASVDINQIDPTFALLHTSCNEALICVHVLRIAICDTFESRAWGSILFNFHVGNLFNIINDSSVIEDSHLSISEADGSNFVLKFAHFIEHLEFAIPEATVCIIASCRENLLFYSQAED